MEEEESYSSSDQSEDFSSSDESVREQRAASRNFHEKELRSLQRNETVSFAIRKRCCGACYDDDHEDYELISVNTSRWTIEQWNTLLAELKKNMSVRSVDVELRCIPVESLSVLVDYVRTSQRLKKLILHYIYLDVNFPGLPRIPTRYKSKIDEILRAARQNPRIESLQLDGCLGSHQSIQELLAGNSSLPQFSLLRYKGRHHNEAMARAIAAGLRGRSKALKHVLLGMLDSNEGHLKTILSGLCHRGTDDLPTSSLEQLTLHLEKKQSHDPVGLGLKVVEIFKSTPSLKKLTIMGGDGYFGKVECRRTAQPWVESLLKNLHDPACAGLESLVLNKVIIASGGDSGGEYSSGVKDEEGSTMATIESHRGNSTVQELQFDDVTFGHEVDSRCLLNFNGLKRVDVKYHDASIHENDCRCWAELIRNCTSLTHVRVGVLHSDGLSSRYIIRMFTAILEVAAGAPHCHEFLEDLQLYSMGSVVEIPGEKLRSLLSQLLGAAKRLQKLLLADIGRQDDLAAGLAECLGVNETLTKLGVNIVHMSPSNLVAILESLFENKTLQRLSNESTGRSFCRPSQKILETLSRLFRVNKSLNHIALPKLDLRGAGIHDFVQRFIDIAAPKSLDLRLCEIDLPGLLFLVQAFVGNPTMPMEHIGLPSWDPLYWTLSDFKQFYQSIGMSRLKTVNFNHYEYCTNDDHDEDCLKLLLDSTKKNTSISSFGGILESSDSRLIVHEIKYNLKLNRFGRHALSSSSTPSTTKPLKSHVWPAIFARMTKKSGDNEENDNADALYFFVHEYFSRFSYPLMRQPQQQQQQGPPPEQPQSKRARVN